MSGFCRTAESKVKSTDDDDDTVVRFRPTAPARSGLDTSNQAQSKDLWLESMMLMLLAKNITTWSCSGGTLMMKQAWSTTIQHQVRVPLQRNPSHHDTCRFSSLSAYVSNGSRSRVASVLRPHRNTSSEAATAAMMHATMGAGRSAWGNDFGANAPPSMSFTNHSQSVSRDEVKSATRSCTTCYKAKAKCVRKLGEQNCERYDFPFWLRGALAGLRRHEILPLGQSRTV